MGSDNLVFLEVIEWFDPTGKEMLARIPAVGSGEIKFGAQLTVRESQVAVFFYQGHAVHAFGPGRHTLKTGNIPILTKLLSIPWGMTSPLRAEVYFINMKVFTNLKWGTRDPVAFKDQELGPIRLRAFGVLNVRVVQPILFINSLVGTVHRFSTDDIEDYFNQVVVSRFNDFLGENLDTLVNLPARYDEWSQGLKERLAVDLAHFGLKVTDLYINSITPPPEVQQAIDDRSKLGVFEDLNQLMQMKAAMAIEKAAGSQGTAGEGMGLGMGFMMPAMMSQFWGAPPAAGATGPTIAGAAGPTGPATPAVQTCPDCAGKVPADAQFCPYCGHQIMVFTQCRQCGKNLSPNAKFCSRCGASVEQQPQPKKCSHCGAENLPQAVFCNACGERL